MEILVIYIYVFDKVIGINCFLIKGIFQLSHVTLCSNKFKDEHEGKNAPIDR